MFDVVLSQMRLLIGTNCKRSDNMNEREILFPFFIFFMQSPIWWDRSCIQKWNTCVMNPQSHTPAISKKSSKRIDKGSLWKLRSSGKILKLCKEETKINMNWTFAISVFKLPSWSQWHTHSETKSIQRVHKPAALYWSCALLAPIVFSHVV